MRCVGWVGLRRGGGGGIVGRFGCVVWGIVGFGATLRCTGRRGRFYNAAFDWLMPGLLAGLVVESEWHSGWTGGRNSEPHPS